MNNKEKLAIALSIVLLCLGYVSYVVKETNIYLLLSIGAILIGAIYFIFSAVRRLYDKMEQDKFDTLKRVNEVAKDLENRSYFDFKQMEALMNIHVALPDTTNIPYTRGWAASPDVLQLIIENFMKYKPTNIIECGSGVSTLIFASLLKKHNIDGKVISLDHDTFYANKTRERLKENGLENYVTILDSEMKEYNLSEEKYTWYNFEKLDDSISFDMAFIDGPPTLTNPKARFPFFPLLKERLSSNFVLVVDDAIRKDEKTMVKDWLAMDPEMTMEEVSCEKGAILVRK